MSLSEIENQEELNNELAQLTNQIEIEKAHDRKRMIISWVTSGLLHITLIMLASMAYFITLENRDIELPPTVITTAFIQPIKKPVETIKKIELLDNVVLIETTTKDDDAKVPIVDLDIPEDIKNSSDEDKNPSNIKKGNEEFVSDIETGSNAFFTNIGAGSGSSGMFGNRIGGGDKRTRAKMGPMGKPATASTDAGLRWLKKHQSPNGMWDAENYFQNCTDAQKCEPGSLMGYKADQVNVAMTGYAIGCFLGAGYDHKTPNKYKLVVSKGIKYLLDIQKPEGMLGDRNYEHPIASLALIEAYGMSCDPELRDPAQKAVDVIIAHQTIEKLEDPYSGLLWDYSKVNITRADLSVTGWNIMALKSAVGAGLNVKNSIIGAKKAIDRVWKAANPDWAKKTDPYTDMTIFPYTWNASTNATDKDHLSFVGATCAVFMGHRAGDPMLETLLNDAENRWIKSGAYKKNNYACYYLSLSMFQSGGDRWKRCLETLIPYALETQDKTGGCLQGSWSSSGQGWHGANIGRVINTCYNILNLEVAYRYAQVNGGLEKILKKK